MSMATVTYKVIMTRLVGGEYASAEEVLASLRL